MKDLFTPAAQKEAWMTRLITSLVVLLTLATPARAELRPSEWTFLVAAATDGVTTGLCLAQQGCEEGNPLLAPIQRHVGTPGFLAINAGGDVLGLYWMHRIGRRHPRAEAMTLYLFSTIRFAASANNVRMVIHLRRHPP